VIIEHLRQEGYHSGITILKEHLRPQFLAAKNHQRTSYLPAVAVPVH